MKGEKIKQFLFYFIPILLLQIYFFVHNYSFQLEIYWPFLLALISSILTLYYIGYNTFSNKSKFTFSFCVFIIIPIQFFDLIRILFHFFIEYKIYKLLLFLLFFVIVSLSIYKVSQKKSFYKLLKIISLSSVLLIFIRIYNIKTEYTNNLKSINTSKFLSKNKYNIIFIIFDEYTSSNVLRSIFEYDNPIDSFNRKGFFVSKNSKSFYTSTFFSLNHLYSLGESKLDVNYFNFPIALKNIENNILIEILEINKYKYCFRSFLDYKNHKNLERQPYLDNAYKFNTISSSIFPYIATQIQTNYWFNILNQDHFKNEIINDFNRRRIKTNSYNEELLKIFSTTMEKKFYHFHYTIPHNPYIYNEDGSIDTSSRNLLYINKKGYLKNLKYTNKQLSFILDSFSKSKIKDNTILIIQGDHGYRGGEVSEQEKLGILNIIHLPDKNYNILNDSISNVNTFKTILNHYFN